VAFGFVFNDYSKPTPPPIRQEYIPGMRLAVRLSTGELEEIAQEKIPGLLFGGKWIPLKTPLSNMPIVVL
jgi:hypothetical protein